MIFYPRIGHPSALGKQLALFVIGAFALVSGAAHATLMNNGGGLIYDSDLNITWLQDANYAAIDLNTPNRVTNMLGQTLTTAFGPHTIVAGDFQTVGTTYTGNMTWWGAMEWAQTLSFGGVTGWRLPTINSTSPTATAHNCSSGTAAACASSGNELGYMYYFDLPGTGNKTGNQSPFTGIGLAFGCCDWSATEFDSSLAWVFDFLVGVQRSVDESFSLSAWAVHAGDVSAAAAPEPASMFLFGVGALGLALSRRRGRRR